MRPATGGAGGLFQSSGQFVAAAMLLTV